MINFLTIKMVQKPKMVAFLVIGLFLFLPFGPVNTPDVAYSVQNLENCTDAENCIRGGAVEANPTGDVSDPSGRVTSVFQFAANVLSWVVGVVSVIMIIFGAFKVITSAGDQNNIAVGRKAIVYAIAGLIVALFAQVLVRLVVTSLE
jgi:fumarate reductase subunit D